MGPIYRIETQSEYTVLIELTSGHKIILDLSKKLHSIRFREIANQDVFKRAYTDGYSVIWKNGKIMISFGEIIDILQDLNLLYRVV